MNKTERFENGAHYVFYGPNATLVNWMEDSDLAGIVMEDAGLDHGTIHRAFSTHNPEEQMKAGKQAIGQLWHACPEFGPYPFLDTLSAFEFTGKFYPDYREHVNHQLRVFWLGLYLFDACLPLRDRLLRETGSRNEFLRSWRACAICHDIGYVLENEGANEPGGDACSARALFSRFFFVREQLFSGIGVSQDNFAPSHDNIPVVSPDNLPFRSGIIFRYLPRARR